MSYCDLDDLKKSLPTQVIKELTDDKGEYVSGDFTSEMTAIITETIASADAIIDDYCRGRYTLPFTTVPQTIKHAAVTISIYLLSSRIKQLSLEDIRRANYEDTLQYLVRVSNGMVTLDIDPTPESTTIVPTKSNKTTADRMFPTTTLNKF